MTNVSLYSSHSVCVRTPLCSSSITHVFSWGKIPRVRVRAKVRVRVRARFRVRARVRVRVNVRARVRVSVRARVRVRVRVTHHSRGYCFGQRNK
jgi:hypothetical protein